MQVFHCNFVAARESERSLKDVLELADVARKVVALELLQRWRRETRRRVARLRGKALEDRRRDEADVVPAFPQRRHGELDNVDPIEKVLAEAAGRNELRELL